MKVAISNIAWEPAEDERVAEIMAARGIEGVEIAPTKIWPDLSAADAHGIAECRQWWRRRDIQIVALQSLLFGRPDLNLFSTLEVRRQMLDYLSEVIRVGSLLGAKVLVFGSPKNRQAGALPPVVAMDTAVEFFSQLAAIAQQAGVTIGLEPNPQEYGCDFIRTSQEALQLVKRVAHPGFRVHLDTAILAMAGESVEEAVGACFEYLAHVHISERMLGVVGSGSVDHAPMARALRSYGYREWISIEMRSGAADNTVAVASALDVVTRTYSD